MTETRLLFLCLLIPLLISCAISSGERIREIADNKHFSYRIEQSGGFSHAVFSNDKVTLASDALHVYLEGDGIPWRFRYVVSSDPTPRNPLMLDLMEKDPSSAIYVGRPCYNGFYNEPSCSSKLWTMARHSKPVVNSMAAVIERIRTERRVDKLHLYGHSGGGAMAMLLAARLKSVEVVVTLAGNLDLTAWTKYHGYTPLYGSVNPATQPFLDSSIQQLHLLGGKDKNIPVELVIDWIQLQANGLFYVFNDFTHNCCWAKAWSSVLSYVNSNYETPHTDVQLLPGFGSLTQNLTSQVLVD